MKDLFLVHNWRPDDMPYAFYTEGGDLRTIHRSFGHHDLKATEDPLRRSKGAELDRTTKEMVKKIADGCAVCKTHAPTPRRFKLTIGTGDLSFNHDLQVDTMFL